MSENRRRRREIDDDVDSEPDLPPSSPQQTARSLGLGANSSPIGSPYYGDEDQGNDMINPEGDDNEIDDNPDIDEVEERMNQVDLIDDDMYRDYALDPEKDRYDTNQLDDTAQIGRAHV